MLKINHWVWYCLSPIIALLLNLEIDDCKRDQRVWDLLPGYQLKRISARTDFEYLYANKDYQTKTIYFLESGDLSVVGLRWAFLKDDAILGPCFVFPQLMIMPRRLRQIFIPFFFLLIGDKPSHAPRVHATPQKPWKIPGIAG